MNTTYRAPSTTLSKAEQDLINDVTQKITQHSNELRKRYRALGFQNVIGASVMALSRSEERRVGKECRSRWSPYH